MTRADARGLHVLYVAWGFPPCQGPGVHRSVVTVAELVRQGHRVTVLTADLATFDLVTGGDRSLLERVPQAVRVVRVAMAARARDPLLNRWPADRMADPKVWGDTVQKQQVRAFPEAVYGTWQPRAEAVANRIHELEPVDLVIATGNPYVDFSVALRLHVDHGVPFVLDDRDSWLLDSSTGEPRPLAGRILPWLEFALSQALSTWFANPIIADWHRNRFPQYADRIRVVESGRDPWLDGGTDGAPEVEADDTGEVEADDAGEVEADGAGEVEADGAGEVEADGAAGVHADDAAAALRQALRDVTALAS